YENYVTHKDVIESILSLREGEAVVKPKRKYTRRKKQRIKNRSFVRCNTKVGGFKLPTFFYAHFFRNYLLHILKRSPFNLILIQNGNKRSSVILREYC